MNIVMNLQGQWHFCLDKEKQGLNAHYETLSFTDTITLPTTISEAEKGTPHGRKETGHLTDPYEMEGCSWYQRVLTLPLQDTSELSGKHFELTLERTRISYVWVDGQFAGSQDSFVARHRYDLTGLITTLNPVITIMVSNTDYKVPGGHLTSPDTQTNWNGILGEISLRIRESIQFGAIDAGCRYAEKSILLKIPVRYYGSRPCPARILVNPVLCRLKDIYAKQDGIIPEGENYENLLEYKPLPHEAAYIDVTLQPGENHFELLLNLSEDPKLWDEEDPYVYRLHLTCREVGACTRASADQKTRNSSEDGNAAKSSYACDTASLWCGLRSFTAGKSYIYINGRKTFLRGKHEGMVFPLTGYAPTDVTSWLRVMKTARNYGINHYRFHTCCPPEAAFIAADLLGIYMQPELPFWGTFNGPEDEGYNRDAQEFLEQEGFRMLEAFGSHPSYCMMSMGNELWGNASAINELLSKYKAFRPDVLYAQGSNNFFWTPNIQPCDDFFSGVRFTIDRQIRGSYAMCDAPLGHVQTAAPGTRFHYDEAIRSSCLAASSTPALCFDGADSPSCPTLSSESTICCNGSDSPSHRTACLEPENAKSGDKKSMDEDDTVEIQYGTGVKRVRLSEIRSELIPEVPVISHEIGQYVFYPDFQEISKYTGVLKAHNLEEFKKRLDAAGMLGFAKDFFRCAGAFAVACYRDELETALRSSQLAGFQLLDLQDFPGQGTALVGILNAFMENKGLISASDWRKFCDDAVLQAEFDSYVITLEKPFTFTVSLSYYRKAPLPADELVCCLTDNDGTVIWRDSKPVTKLTERNRHCSDLKAASNLYDIADTFVQTPGAFAQSDYPVGEYSQKILTCDKGVFLLDKFTLGYSSQGNSLSQKNSFSQRNSLSQEKSFPQGDTFSRREGIFPELKKPSILTLTVELTGLGISNSYQLWLYPAMQACNPNQSETVLSSIPLTPQKAVACSLEQLPALAKNHRTGLLFLPAEENKASVQGTYCTDFWCYTMFNSISLNIGKESPVGTMGLLIRREHEALSGFPCETYSTPQWHSIVNVSRSTILDGTNIVPVVQTIDNFFRNHRLGLIYEIYLQDLDLHLLVCTSDLPGLIRAGHPEALALYRSLVSCLPSLEDKARNAGAADTGVKALPAASNDGREISSANVPGRNTNTPGKDAGGKDAGGMDANGMDTNAGYMTLATFRELVSGEVAPACKVGESDHEVK